MNIHAKWLASTAVSREDRKLEGEREGGKRGWKEGEEEEEGRKRKRKGRGRKKEGGRAVNIHNEQKCRYILLTTLFLWCPVPRWQKPAPP